MKLIEFTDQLYAELKIHFPGPDCQQMTVLELSNLLSRIFTVLKEIRLFISKNPFRDITEEVIFFKEIKPLFTSELIYYSGLFQLSARSPRESMIRRKNFLLSEMEKLSALFVEHEQVYDYWCTGQISMDKAWFCMGGGLFCPAEYFNDLAGINRDGEFSTSKDHLIAAFMAYERLLAFCELQLRYCDSEGGIQIQHKLPWTDSKASLIELAYALQARGSLASGKAEIKQVIELLEYAFDIDLGNYYGVFTQNIRLRKKNRTVYLDQLKEYLERRMDDLDE